MDEPRNFLDSLHEFRDLYSSDEIAMVIIPSSKWHYEELTLASLDKEGLVIPSSNIFYYVPPRQVGHSKYPREEKIPKLPCDLPAYILVDDQIQTGDTLDFALKRLHEQNIAPEKVWVCVNSLLMPKVRSHGIYLDRAKIFLDYITTTDQ